jgi:hypothetical protein
MPKITVTQTSDNVENIVEGSLRKAIEIAGDDDTIEFVVSEPTITLADQITITQKNLTIEGPGKDKLTISGSNQSRIFRIEPSIDPGAKVTIKGLTIAHGRAPNKSKPEKNTPKFHGLGGGILNLGNLTLIDIRICDNNAAGHPDDTLSFTGWNFRGAAGGGGVANLGRLTVEGDDSEFQGNVASGASDFKLSDDKSNALPGFAFGGGLVNVPPVAKVPSDVTMASAKVSNCTFTGNQAKGGNNCTCTSGILPLAGDASGGAIASFAASAPPDEAPNNKADLSVDHCLFSNNQAIGGDDNESPLLPGHSFGGAIASHNLKGEAVVHISNNSTFEQNESIGGNRNKVTKGSAGALDALRAIPNMAAAGGVFACGTGEISGVRFSNNRVFGGRGGSPGSTGLDITKNGGDARGGALAVAFQDTNITVDNCTVDNNWAVGGRAIAGGNNGTAWGGGIANANPGLSSPYAELTISGGTIVKSNSAVGGLGRQGRGIGGGIYNIGKYTLDGTVISNNHASFKYPDIYSDGGTSGAPIGGGYALGGGVYNVASSTTNLKNVTITENFAVGGRDWLLIVDEVVRDAHADIWEPGKKLRQWEMQLDNLIAVLGRVQLDPAQEKAVEYLNAARREFDAAAALVRATRPANPVEQARLLKEIATRIQSARASIYQFVEAEELPVEFPFWECGQTARLATTARQ